MSRYLRANRILIGLITAVGALCASLGIWYWSSADTTTVLAALVEPTPTASPNSAPKRNPTEKAQRKQEKQKAQAGIAAGAFGTLQALNGQTLTLETADGSAPTVTTSNATRWIVVGKPNATAGDLRVGDKVLVIGAKNNQGDPASLSPRVIVSAPAAYTQKNVLLGRLDSASSTTLQITTSAGPKTITLAPTAQTFGKAFNSLSASALKTNPNVLVLGEPGANETFTAQVVLNLPRANALAGMTRQQRKTQKRAAKQERKQSKRAGKSVITFPAPFTLTDLAAGKIKSVTSTGLALKTANGALTLAVTKETQIFSRDGSPLTVTDLQPKQRVLVLGIAGPSGELASRVILALGKK